jgi:hypothetical protein
VLVGEAEVMHEGLDAEASELGLDGVAGGVWIGFGLGTDSPDSFLVGFFFCCGAGARTFWDVELLAEPERSCALVVGMVLRSDAGDGAGCGAWCPNSTDVVELKRGRESE